MPEIFGLPEAAVSVLAHRLVSVSLLRTIPADEIRRDGEDRSDRTQLRAAD
jgi:hypothetical protein